MTLALYVISSIVSVLPNLTKSFLTQQVFISVCHGLIVIDPPIFKGGGMALINRAILALYNQMLNQQPIPGSTPGIFYLNAAFICSSVKFRYDKLGSQ